MCTSLLYEQLGCEEGVDYCYSHEAITVPIGIIVVHHIKKNVCTVYEECIRDVCEYLYDS